ncbi:hypothetical protein AX15_007443 [Amanita polypyramis BW_CC]|nr:hypothetical protein AX15_007443 [Amanita polypyramis BW_CC]
MFPKTLLSTVLLALAVSASPVRPRDALTKLSLARHMDLNGGQSLLEHDLARARHLVARLLGLETDEPLTNTGVTYTASVGVGLPPTTYELLVDTGSSNTWVGADKNKPYHQTSTSTPTPNKVSVTYGSGSFSGDEYVDTVTIGDLVISQSIGAAVNSTGFGAGIDGIIGIGPVDLTKGTLSPATDVTVPTVTDSAYSQGKIYQNQIGISFEPITNAPDQNGEITWGGVDPDKYTGEITWAPITSTSPASQYWGIDQSITYGDSATILDVTAGIVDTGTTLILLATDGFQKYQAATGGVVDPATTLLKITPAQYGDLKPLNFQVNGNTFTLTPNAQIWPRSLNSAIGGDPSSIYLVVADLQTRSGAGLDFINGYTFLERFYSVYDTANQRVGLATTPFTEATSN